jgi:lia operon protein LiaF
MHKHSQRILGLVLIVLGVLFIISRFLHISAWALIWPLLLIIIGIWIIFREKQAEEGSGFEFKLLGDISREGKWNLQTEEFKVLIGDINLDLMQADIPDGETLLTMHWFVGDVELKIPRDVGISLSSGGLVVDTYVFGEKEEKFFGTVQKNSSNYGKAKKQIRVKANCFVGDIKVFQQ